MTLPLARHWRELLVLLALMAITTPLFWLTDLDRQAAALFYQADTWTARDWWLWQGLFRYAPKVLVGIAITAAALAAASYRWTFLQKWRRPALYVLLVIAIGPGVTINWVFKDHWGRPRPLHMVEFGGQNAYVPPLQMADTPHKSFPCGHCSVGYALFAAYFLARKRKAWYLAASLAAGLFMGLSRMAAGGHFLSDILWSGYLVFLVAWLLYYGWYRREDWQSSLS
jgi:lipid A 4'-phosphatase